MQVAVINQNLKKMGKFVGLIGTVSGKVGNVVFAKGADGITYGRTYQPVVANPKTIGQTDQRAKMNLTGRMTKVTPVEVILGMGVSKRERRSMFNKNLLDVAVIDRSQPGVVIAKVEPEDIIFSQGSQSLEASVSTPGATTGTEATIGLTLGDASLSNKYGERIVVAVIDPTDKAGYSLVKYTDVVFDSTTAKTATVRYGTPIASESLVCIYRVPFRLTDEGAALRMQTIANDGVDIIAKVLSSGNLVRAWGLSKLAATQVFMQA